jgi:DHA2 family multidrug resistance protein-like MFS transporter
MRTVTSVGAPKAGVREWVGLAVLALPTFLVAIDVFVLLLALPHLSADLGASSTQQLWIMDIYGFLLAGFLVTMGTLGDRIGRRKLLLIGAVAFGIASVFTAYAQNPGMLIASRAAMGVAGATLTPSTLALISNMFQDAKQRATAIGMWGGIFIIGAIIGPLLGGVMLEHFWWGSVFLIAAPVMVLLLIIGPIILPEYRAPSAGRIDPLSVVLSLATMLPIVWGIKQMARDGWEALPILAIVVGVLAGIGFGKRQGKLSDPLLDLRLFKTRSFNAALGSLLFNSACGGGIMLFMVMYFQVVDGMSTLRAGLAMLPGMAGAMVGFSIGPQLASKFRPAYVIATGVVIASATLFFWTTIGPTGGVVPLMIGFGIYSGSGAPLVALGTNLVVSSAPPEKAGSAGSLAQMANEFGATLGAAILGTIGFAVYRHDIAGAIPDGIPGPAAAAARDSAAGAAAVAGNLPHDLGAALLAPAHAAFANGLNTVALVGAIVQLGIAIVIATLLRHVPPVGKEAPAEEPPGAAGEAAEVADAAPVPATPVQPAVALEEAAD